MSDADGLPLFPPLPGGRAARAPGARSVARLVAGLRTAVVTVETEDVAAMVVFLDHEPVDGLALRGDRRVVGPDALDEIAGVPVEQVSVTEVTPELARVVGSYFLPSELRAVPAGFVVPEDFVRSLSRPGQRGCLLVRAGDALGVAFLAGGRVAMAYRQDGAIGGFEQVAPLFAVPGAVLWARLGPDPTAAPAIPEPEAAPAPLQAPAAPPAPVALTPPSAPNRQASPPPPAAAAPVEVALAAAGDVLGAHSVRVEPLLRRADQTVEGLRAAAESIRERRVRLLSPATMDLVADRIIEALERPGVS